MNSVQLYIIIVRILVSWYHQDEVHILLLTRIEWAEPETRNQKHSGNHWSGKSWFEELAGQFAD